MQVYLITNKINGMMYVGQTIKPLKKRWQQHCTLAKLGKQVITKAIAKYGKDSFIVETLHTCVSKEEMDFVEIFYIHFLDTRCPRGYNLVEGGGNAATNTGRKFSDSTRKKVSKSLLGNTRAKGNIGIIWTDERRKNHRSSVQKFQNTEWRENLSRALTKWSHGTCTGYANHKCRCSMCRAWRHDNYLKQKLGG